jgi:hypothetical protein
MKFPQKPWIGKDRMDEETRRELRRKKFSLVAKNHGSRVTDAWERGKYTT